MGLRKRGGKWQVRVQVRGQQFAETVGTDKKKAIAVQKELESQAADARLSDVAFNKLQKLRATESVVTFEEAAASFLAERQHLKPSSKKQWTSTLKILCAQFGKRPLREITPSQIRSFQSQLASEVVNGRLRSASRVNTIMQPLRTIFGTAFADGVIERNPCAGLKRLPEPGTEINPLSREELELALGCVDEYYRPFFVAQAYTGARPSELQALTWSDIDWYKEEFQITKARVRGAEGRTKTQAGNRVVPMTAPVLAAFKELKGRTVRHAQYVFLNKRGKPIDKHMDTVWAKALRKAQLRHRPSYQLRHTFASLSLLEGLPPPYVAGVMGHGTDLQTFFRHYARWVSAETTTANARLRQAFQNVPQFSSASASEAGQKLDKPAFLGIVNA